MRPGSTTLSHQRMASTTPSVSAGSSPAERRSGVEVAERVDAGEPSAAEAAAGDDQLLVEPVAVGAGDDETGVAHHADVAGLEHLGDRGHGTGGDAGEVLALPGRPHLGPQEPEGLGDEAVAEVAEHDVVAVRRRGRCRR